MANTRQPHFLEVPVFSPAAAREVVSLGADRVELNTDGSYAAGGLTPTVAELAELRRLSSAQATTEVPVRVMIRPRGAPSHPSPAADKIAAAAAPDFIYTDDEFQRGMRDAIVAFRDSGLLDAGHGDGFVFGILKRGDAEGAGLEVDVERNAELVRLASPYPCVFHRAFDDLIGSSASSASKGGSSRQEEDLWSPGLEDVIACGFDGILTSGGPGNAPDNLQVLTRIVERANGRIQIIAGGGVRSGEKLQALVGALDGAVVAEEGAGGWFHSSCLARKDSELCVDGDELGRIKATLRNVC